MTEQLLFELPSHGDAMALVLHPDDPLDVTQGDPHASLLELYSDEVVECGVWEVTPGEFAWDNGEFGEHMYVLSGAATVTSQDGGTVELQPGVSLVAPAGWRGRWDVRETVRKIYVVWKLP